MLFLGIFLNVWIQSYHRLFVTLFKLYVVSVVIAYLSPHRCFSLAKWYERLHPIIVATDMMDPNCRAKARLTQLFIYNCSYYSVHEDVDEVFHKKKNSTTRT